MMGGNITEDELIAFLKAIEKGAILLTPQEDPQQVYAGNVTYLASNGWRMVVFNDANEWDYIDQVATPDQRILVFEEIDAMPEAGQYRPDAAAAWACYGIPGYMKFKCKNCGAALPLQARILPFLCHKCRPGTESGSEKVNHER